MPAKLPRSVARQLIPYRKTLVVNFYATHHNITPPPRLCPHPVEIESSALTHLCLVSVTSNRNSFNLSAVSQEQIQILTACVV